MYGAFDRVVDEAVDGEVVGDGRVALQEPPVRAGGGVGAGEGVELHAFDRGGTRALDLSGVQLVDDLGIGPKALHLAVNCWIS